MAEQGTSNRAALRSINEVTWGTTPDTPAFETLRFTSESLNYSPEYVDSEEIRDDRMETDTIEVLQAAGGDISGEMSYGTYDNLIQAAMFSTWLTTGSALSAVTDVALTKTPGTPNTWALSCTSSNFSNKSWVVGQFVKVTGNDVAGTYFAEIVAINSATSMTIKPLTDVASEAAGDTVTITPMNFIRNGVTRKSVTLQKAFLDLSTPQLMNFKGSRVNTFNLEVASKSLIKAKFNVLAKNAEMTTTQFSGATIAAANANPIMSASRNAASLTFDGDPGNNNYYFNNLSINIDNTLRQQAAVGNIENIGIAGGRVQITGKAQIYFEDAYVFDKFKASTAFSFSFRLLDATGASYIITVPNAKIKKVEIAAGGLDQDVFADVEFKAFVNSAKTHAIQISRLA